MTRTLRIGSGAGFSGDRLDAAVALLEHGELDVLALECLAERTIALAQLRRRKDPSLGYDPRLARRIEPLLPSLRKRGVRLISNLGAANPARRGRRDRVDRAPARRAGEGGRGHRRRRARSHRSGRARRSKAGVPLRSYGPLVSANAYLGADALMPALATGADVVVTGRVADPSLFVAPIAHAPRHRARRLGSARTRDGRRPSARVRRPALRRLFRRSRVARTCPAWRTSAFRSPTSTRAAPRCSARSKAAVVRSPSRPRPSSCSTRSPIRTATSRPT